MGGRSAALRLHTLLQRKAANHTSWRVKKGIPGVFTRALGMASTALLQTRLSTGQGYSPGSQWPGCPPDGGPRGPVAPPAQLIASAEVVEAKGPRGAQR